MDIKNFIFLCFRKIFTFSFLIFISALCFVLSDTHSMYSGRGGTHRPEERDPSILSSKNMTSSARGAPRTKSMGRGVGSGWTAPSLPYAAMTSAAGVRSLGPELDADLEGTEDILAGNIRGTLGPEEVIPSTPKQRLKYFYPPFSSYPNSLPKAVKGVYYIPNTDSKLYLHHLVSPQLKDPWFIISHKESGESLVLLPLRRKEILQSQPDLPGNRDKKQHQMIEGPIYITVQNALLERFHNLLEKIGRLPIFQNRKFQAKILDPNASQIPDFLHEEFKRTVEEEYIPLKVRCKKSCSKCQNSCTCCHPSCPNCQNSCPGCQDSYEECRKNIKLPTPRRCVGVCYIHFVDFDISERQVEEECLCCACTRVSYCPSRSSCGVKHQVTNLRGDCFPYKDCIGRCDTFQECFPTVVKAICCFPIAAIILPVCCSCDLLCHTFSCVRTSCECCGSCCYASCQCACWDIWRKCCCSRKSNSGNQPYNRYQPKYDYRQESVHSDLDNQPYNLYQPEDYRRTSVNYGNIYPPRSYTLIKAVTDYTKNFGHKIKLLNEEFTRAFQHQEPIFLDQVDFRVNASVQ